MWSRQCDLGHGELSEQLDDLSLSKDLKGDRVGMDDALGGDDTGDKDVRVVTDGGFKHGDFKE